MQTEVPVSIIGTDDYVLTTELCSSIYCVSRK